MRHALILETNNIQSAQDAAEIEADLGALLAHLRGQTLRPDDLVITHEGLEEDARTRLDAVAARTITWAEVPAGTNYYDAKRRGFDATDADLVAFGDTDCWPVHEWYALLLGPFIDPDVRVTAGRTTYPASLLGTAVSTIDFMYFAPEGCEEDTLNFYANNVAFRRDVFAEFGYAPRDGVYRGHCQVLGMELRRAGVPIRFVPDARTFHELPASARDFLALRLHRGSDAALLSPDIVTTYAPSPLRHIALSRRLSTAAVMIGRVAMSASSFGQQQMPELKGWRSAAAMGAMLGTSALDGVGALLQLAGARPSRTDTISLNTERHDALRDAS